MPLSTERKKEYFERMKGLLAEFNKVFIVGIDNVGSKQIQETRIGLRGKAEVLMGKNTMMRKVIREFVEENPGTPVTKLEECCRGNVGFVFCSGSLGEVREVLESNTRPAPAKVGSLAPIKVVVPKGPTGCDPGQTAFFQTLQIATKITRGQIEMVNDTELIEAGERVTASQAALLQKLSIEPFTYGMVLKSVYDNGSLFDAKVLDITDSVLAAKFAEALNVIASISLVLGYPTQASVPHSIVNAYKAVLAITMELENYTFDKAELVKEYLKDPSKFAGSGGGGGGGDGAATGGAAAEAKVEEKEEEEEMDLGGGMDMFGGEEGGGGGGGDY
jgi:large subunit ribosomal protein LP0